MAKRPTYTTEHHKKAFLAAYALSGTVLAACEAAKVGRTTHYQWMKDDRDYAEAFRVADQNAGDLLEIEARRRAVEGVEEPVIYQGKPCGVYVNAKGETVSEGTAGATLIPLTIRKKSDTMLIFMMKAAMPDKYGEKATFQHTGANGGPIQTEAVDLSRLTIDELRTLREIRAKAGSPEPSDN